MKAVISKIILILCLLAPMGGLLAQNINKILIISSYGTDYRWSNIIIDSISIEIKRSHPKSEFNIEYLSSERFSDPQAWVDRVNVSLNNYKKDKPSLIIIISDEAWMAYQNSDNHKLKDVPLLLCAIKPHIISLEKFREIGVPLSIDDFESTNQTLKKYYASAVLREINIPKTFELIDKIIPNIDRYLVVTDNRFYGVYTKSLCKEYFKNRSPEREVKYVDARFVNTDSLLKVLPSTPSTTGVLLTSWLTGQVGFEYSKEYVYDKMSSALKAPIFITNDIGLSSNNFIGGYFNMSGFWGRKTGAMAVKVLNGVPPTKIPIETYIEEECYINYNVANKFEINTKNLPSEASFINKQESLFVQYKKSALGIIIIIIIIAIGYAYVISHNIKLKKARNFAQKAIKDSFEANQQLMLAQENLKEALKKAEDADRLKSAFISNMDREIRNPLNLIVGFSSIISSMDDKQEREEIAGQIAENSTKLLELVKSIVDLSQIESGDSAFKLEKVNINAVFQDIKTLCSYKQNIRTEIVLNLPKRGLTIKTDARRISQAIYNLTDNALKFTNEGKIELGYYALDDDWVEFYVKDTGIGIKPEEIDSIFERFYKSDTYSNGAGLGLSISKTIIEKLGGKIGVKTELGVGSKFSFWIKNDII